MRFSVLQPALPLERAGGEDLGKDLCTTALDLGREQWPVSLRVDSACKTGVTQGRQPLVFQTYLFWEPLSCEQAGMRVIGAHYPWPTMLMIKFYPIRWGWKPQTFKSCLAEFYNIELGIRIRNAGGLPLHGRYCSPRLEASGRGSSMFSTTTTWNVGSIMMSWWGQRERQQVMA